MVVLGGFVPNLDQREFLLASLVLLVQAIQFACTASWITVLPAPRLSEWLLYGRWRENACAFWPATGFAMLAHSCIFISCAVSIKELTYLYTGNTDQMCVPAKNLVSMMLVASTKPEKPPAFKTSLTVYYMLVLLNATMALLGVSMTIQRLQIGIVSTWMYSYGHRVLQVALEKGQGAANQIELVDAVFEILGNEWRVQQSAKAMKRVVKVCRPSGDERSFPNAAQAETEEIFKRLCWEVVVYVHGNEQGFEAALQALNSSDRYVQEAAAWMIGFWVDLENNDPPHLWVDCKPTSETSPPRSLPYQVSLLRRIMEIAMDGPLKGPIMRSLEKLARHVQMALLTKEFITKLLDHVEMLIDLLNHHYIDEYQNLLCLYKGVLTRLHENPNFEHSCFKAEQSLCERLSKVLSKTTMEEVPTINVLQTPYFQQDKHIQAGNSVSGSQASSSRHHDSNVAMNVLQTPYFQQDKHIQARKSVSGSQASSGHHDSNVPREIPWKYILIGIIPPLLFYLVTIGLDVLLYYSLCAGDNFLGRTNPFPKKAYNGY